MYESWHTCDCIVCIVLYCIVGRHLLFCSFLRLYDGADHLSGKVVGPQTPDDHRVRAAHDQHRTVEENDGDGREVEGTIDALSGRKVTNA